MKVVLLSNIKGIGKIGDVKEVNDGYARNFLIPRKLGKPASSGVLKEVDALRAQKLHAHLFEQEQASAVVRALQGVTISLTGKSNQKGKLFSAISKEVLAEKLSTLAGAHIDTSSIEADYQLKTVGTHVIHVAIGEHMRADVTLEITPLT